VAEVAIDGGADVVALGPDWFNTAIENEAEFFDQILAIGIGDRYLQYPVKFGIGDYVVFPADGLGYSFENVSRDRDVADVDEFHVEKAQMAVSFACAAG
jgi:hypothetical protein